MIASVLLCLVCAIEGRRLASNATAVLAKPSDLEALELVLVAKGSWEQVVFEHAEVLAEGKDFVALTLTSPAGKAVVRQSPQEMVFAHYHLYKAAVGSADFAVRARLEGEGFLTLEGDGFVFDIDKWNYAINNHIWMLREHDDPKASDTRRGGGGRNFKVNLPEGTVSPTKAPHLVLGFRKPSIQLVTKDSPKRCVFTHADKLREGADNLVPLTLLSPRNGLAVVAQYMEPKSVHDFVDYIETGFGPEEDALHVKYVDGIWIAREKIRASTRYESVDRPGALSQEAEKEYEMVFDVKGGIMAQGSVINMIQLRNVETKELGNAARHFIVNEDGTISPAAAPNLVWGMEHLL